MERLQPTYWSYFKAIEFIGSRLLRESWTGQETRIVRSSFLGDLPHVPRPTMEVALRLIMRGGPILNLPPMIDEADMPMGAELEAVRRAG